MDWGISLVTTLFKKVDYSLGKLIQDIEMGEIGLPDIQRPFVWSNTKVRDLLDSMYRGYPVGYFLFWECGNPAENRQIGTDSKQKTPRLLIVDGQQRLTALYAVIKGQEVIHEDYRRSKIVIAFRPRDGTFRVGDATTAKDPEYIPDISDLWSIQNTRTRFVKDFLIRLRANQVVDEDLEDKLSTAIDTLFDIQNYPFTALELSPSLDDEQVAEIFVRINSLGKSLVQADFILTLLSIFWDEGRADLERFCRESHVPSVSEASSFNYFIEPSPDQLLRVGIGLGFRRAVLRYAYLVLRGKDMDTKLFSAERRDAQFAILKEAQRYTLNLQNWHDFFKALVRAGYRKSNMISSENAIIFSYILYLVGKRDFKIDEFRVRNAIARWFFMVSITSRYSGSPESVMEQDLTRFRDIKDPEVFLSTLDRIVKETLTDDYWNITLPNELERSSTRSPALFAYYAALNLLDAKVLFSKVKVSELLDPVSKANKSPIEVHHLFPKAYLKQIGFIDDKEINQIANYSLVEWADNIGIMDNPPSQYFPGYSSRYSPEEIRSMMYWHALPEGWENLDYNDFLTKRRKAMALVIRDGFSKLWDHEVVAKPLDIDMSGKRN